MSASGPPPDVSSPVEGRTGDESIASGESPNRAVRPAGRDDELSRIGELLAAARQGRAGVLVVEGEPGIGKTTLLETARDLAVGFTVVSATGVESESVLGHAGLLELMTPLRSLLAEVPEAQAAALAAALGWVPAEAAADRFLVSAATLSLLAVAAERAPVLVLVDDLQWLDGESAAAVLFAARRLGPDAVAFVIAARPSSAPLGLRDGLPHVRLTGLAVDAAARLLPTGTTEAVVARVVDGTRGNPLALLEVGRSMTPAQRVGAAPLPDPLPLGERLDSVYGRLLAALSPEASKAVLLLAIDPALPSTAAASAMSADGADAGAAFDEAEHNGILQSGEGGPRFRHPLVRAAVLRHASPDRRRAAHRALAAVLADGAPTAVWHLAEATVGPNDALADELESLGAVDRVRLGYGAASLALERAATLTTDPARVARRLALATHDAFVAGDAARTRSLAARVLEGRSPAGARGQVLFTAGMLEQYAGSVPRSTGYLEEARRLLDGAGRVRALAELALARFRLGDVSGIAECAERIVEVADVTEPEQRLLSRFTTGMSLMLHGSADESRADLDEVRDLALSDALRHDPRALILAAVSVGLVGDIGDHLSSLAARLDDVRRRGAVGVLVPLLALSSAGRAWIGDHAGAFADAGEAVELAQQIGYAADAAVAVEMLAWQSAARGWHDDARSALHRARTLTDRAGTTSAAAHQALTAAFCALCRGDLDEAVTLLEGRIATDGGVGDVGEPLGVAPLLVEAYAALGRSGDAADLTGRYIEVVGAPANPLTTALVARCEGITATDATVAAAAFERSAAAHAVAGNPFEEARTRLLYGARLRRDGQRVAARDQLRTARAAFGAMDLTHWADAAADELAATGATARRRHAGTDEALTSQETRVALMVAKGLSNREVAAALFLSPRTVERHLGSVFRKRGYRSRTELAAAYAIGDDPSAH